VGNGAVDDAARVMRRREGPKHVDR